MFNKKFYSNCTSWIRYKILPPLVDVLVNLSISNLKDNIHKNNATRILIDTNIYDAAIIQETAWIGTGINNWGDTHQINTGYTARIPVYDDNDTSKAVQSIKYLPGIFALSSKNILTLFDSPELEDERFTQPVGRFKGYGFYDYSLIEKAKIEKLKDNEYYWTMAPSFLKTPSLTEQRKSRLEKKRKHPLYNELVKTLGEKNSQDAWHIFTAETNSCYCFLTMDFSLIKNIKSQKGSKVIKNLKTKIITPEDFGIEFGIRPISPRLFAYHKASFPVLHNQNWRNSKRRNKA